MITASVMKGLKTEYDYSSVEVLSTVSVSVPNANSF